MPVVQRVCVIGAGVSGLVATKTCLEEGMDPVCLERSSEIGGVWAYKDTPIPGRTEGQLYHCLVTNSSKYLMNFSDFPFPKTAPPYIPGKDVKLYYEAYADQFDLRRHIRFNTEVTEVTPTGDYEETGRWSVTSRDRGGNPVTETYDAVMLCTGFYSRCVTPKYPGQGEFKGQILHSNEFRDGREYRRKTVLVIGGSHSAGDVASDSSFHAKQVYLSVRHGAWAMPRNALNGVPRDMVRHTRFKMLLPLSLKMWLMKKEIEEHSNLYHLGLLPTKEIFSSGLMISDVIEARIIAGYIKAKPGVERFTENGVVFTDGSKVDDLDVVIFATGYESYTPFIDKNIIGESVNDIELYLSVFPACLKHNTLAAVGFFATMGSHGPVMELQSRWACRVFQDYCKLPSKEFMMEEVRKTKQKMYKMFGSQRDFFPPVPYCERLAASIGVKPNLLRMALTDPVLAYKCFFEPTYPFSYRLEGPNAWEGAREAIMNAWDNTILSTKTRTPNEVESCGDPPFSVESLQLVVVCFPLICFLFTYFFV